MLALLSHGSTLIIFAWAWLSCYQGLPMPYVADKNGWRTQ